MTLAVSHYKSPIGGITLAADGNALIGLWFDRQKYFLGTLSDEYEKKELTVFEDAKRWLDIYFSGKVPEFIPNLKMQGSRFRIRVWESLLRIPYGHVITYNDIANEIAHERGLLQMSAQAVGNAIGHNTISLIIPCHRVIGTDGGLTGYAGGIEKKEWLLRMEKNPSIMYENFCKTIKDLPQLIMTEQVFKYGEQEVAYLKRKDKRLACVIDRIGHIYRRVIPNLYIALLNSIVGQQISTKAHDTVWRHMNEKLGKITPEKLECMTLEDIQHCGLSFRKAVYIKSMTHKIVSGEFNLMELYSLSDAEVCRRLSSLEGIGEWTAEMLMLFSLQRPDILSYKDLAIVRGMKMVYHHKEMTHERFERYRQRLSPYGSVASLYFWAVANGQ